MAFIDHGTLVLMIPLAGIGTGALAVYLSHIRKIEELRARKGGVETSVSSNREVAAELQSLRRELETLRDNSSRFDLSFDAGLTRLEGRIAHVEENQYGRTTSRSEEPAVLRAGSPR